MTNKDLKAIFIVAVITTISLTLPSQLFVRGLPLSWAIALLAGYTVVAGLGYLLKQYLE